MAIERWEPRRSLAAWQPFRAMEQFENQFEDILSGGMQPVFRGDGDRAEEMMPKMDIFEKDDKFVVKAELPGMKGEDIDISISGDIMTIKGEKKSESEVDEGNYYKRETSYGSFARSIRLPSSVDIDKISAASEDGMLEIELPKAVAVQPKKIVTSSKKAEPKAKAAKTPKPKDKKEAAAK